MEELVALHLALNRDSSEEQREGFIRMTRKGKILLIGGENDKSI